MYILAECVFFVSRAHPPDPTMPLQRKSKSTTVPYRIPKIRKKSKCVSWNPTDVLDRARALNLLPTKVTPADIAFAETVSQLRRECEGRH